jgi:uncharacterized membrane protein YdfJ with MMPL/SSD domain
MPVDIAPPAPLAAPIPHFRTMAFLAGGAVAVAVLGALQLLLRLL